MVTNHILLAGLVVWLSAFLVTVAVAFAVTRRRRRATGSQRSERTAETARWRRRRGPRRPGLETIAGILLLVGIALTVAYMVRSG